MSNVRALKPARLRIADWNDHLSKLNAARSDAEACAPLEALERMLHAAIGRLFNGVTGAWQFWPAEDGSTTAHAMPPLGCWRILPDGRVEPLPEARP